MLPKKVTPTKMSMKVHLEKFKISAMTNMIKVSKLASFNIFVQGGV